MSEEFWIVLLTRSCVAYRFFAGMWNVTSLDTASSTQRYACDGYPILNHYCRAADGICRIVIAPYGYIDFVEREFHEGGLIYSKLSMNDQEAVIGAETSIEIAVSDDHGFDVNINGASFVGQLKALSVLPGETINAFREMIDLKIVPYQDPPSGTPKSDAQLQALADHYFPGNIYGFDYAMALYDWTSSSFIRQDLFHQLQYTGVAGHPLDLPKIGSVIWNCNYPGYSAKDANFMNQFMMLPATSEVDVSQQLQAVHEKVKPLAVSEMDVQVNALLALAPPTVAKYPQLYRGAMPLSGGYTTADFAPSLFEFPGNAGPTTDPLYKAFDEALNGILRAGSVITTKGPWSFSNDEVGAKVWQNGILITLNPPEGAEFWPSCADITAFSLNPGTFEINMPPVTRYRIDSYGWITIKGKPVCHFTMTHLGYSVEPL